MENLGKFKPILYIDTPNVFSELQTNPISILENICHKKLTIEALELEVQNYISSLKSISNIDSTVKSLIRNKILNSTEIDDKDVDLNNILRSLRLAYYRKEKKKKNVNKEGLVEIKNHNKVPEIEKKLIELCDHGLDQEKFEQMINGPDYPFKENVGASQNEHFKMDFKIILPSNILELYVVYHYLKIEYNISDEQFIFYHDLQTQIDLSIKQFSLSTKVLQSTSFSNNLIWIMMADPLRFNNIYNKYPNLKITSILFTRLELKLEKRKIQLQFAQDFSIRGRIRDFTQIRCKIQFTIKFFEEIKKLVELGKSYEEAFNKINSSVLKVAYKFYEGKIACQRHFIMYDQFPFEYNVIGVLPGENRDYDVFIAKHKHQHELERTIEQIKKERDENHENKFSSIVEMFNKPEGELIVRNRNKTRGFIQGQADIWNIKEGHEDCQLGFAKSIIISSKYSLQELEVASKQLGAYPEDIFIIKPINSSFHNMFYAKNLMDIPNLIEHILKENKEPIDEEIGIQLFFQVGRPHYDACVKHYYICGTSFFNYQETLEECYFDKSSEPMIGEIDRRLAYNQVSENLDKYVPFLKVKKFMEQVSKAIDYQGIGLDYVVSKRDHSITIIDFNSYPGYKVVKKPQLRHIHDRYFTDLLLKQKNEHFEYYQQLGGFTSGQIFSITSSHISIQHGFINRSYNVSNIGEEVSSGQYLVEEVGGENHAEEERIKGFTQEFYGRVIQLKNVESGALSYIVTNYSTSKNELRKNLISVDFEELFNMFDCVKTGYSATITL